MESVADPDQRTRRIASAKELAARLTDDNVRGLALTWIDNAGITRVKTVPVDRLPDVAGWGVGMSSVFDVFLVDDSITGGRYAGGPVGDLRLYPDLQRVAVLSALPGWAWAPVDRLTQDGEAYPMCQRSFAQRMAAAAAEREVGFRCAFEIEWYVGVSGSDGDLEPGGPGPAYGMARLSYLADYARALLEALDAQGVPVDQFHPEYAPGQLEISVAATDPVEAADRYVLVRETIRAVSRAHGLRASFAPVVEAGAVGNGAHLHFSAWAQGKNLFAGGYGPHGITDRGESILAELVARMPALCAVTAPSVTSYLRLVPQQWAAPYQCWGRENREAALRLVTGSRGSEPRAANAELKCVDGSANPYLVVGAVLAIALAGVDAGRPLPPEVTVDPATLPEERRPPRLPQSVLAAVDLLEEDEVLGEALGAPLLDTFATVRRAEADLYAGVDEEEVVAATRWRY